MSNHGLNVNSIDKGFFYNFKKNNSKVSNTIHVFEILTSPDTHFKQLLIFTTVSILRNVTDSFLKQKRALYTIEQQ